MSGPQITFYVVTLGLSVLGTAVLYPGVRRHAESAKNSLLAAFMASALGATAMALVISALYNALSQLSG